MRVKGHSTESTTCMWKIAACISNDGVQHSIVHLMIRDDQIHIINKWYSTERQVVWHRLCASDGHFLTHGLKEGKRKSIYSPPQSVGNINIELNTYNVCALVQSHGQEWWFKGQFGIESRLYADEANIGNLFVPCWVPALTRPVLVVLERVWAGKVCQTNYLYTLTTQEHHRVSKMLFSV